MKYFAGVALILSLMACSAPKPPCCTGLDLHPINPDKLTQEQLKVSQSDLKEGTKIWKREM